MKKPIPTTSRFGVAVWLMVAGIHDLSAATFDEDFSGGLMAERWTVIGNSPLYLINDQAGDVRFSKPFGGGQTFQFVGAESRYRLRGDFDLRIDFRDAMIDRVGGNPGNQVQLNLTFGEQELSVVRSDEWIAGHNVHVFASPPSEWQGQQGTTATSGTLRVIRTGIHVQSYFNTTLLVATDYNSEDVAFTFTLQNNGTPDPTSVTFDNVAMTADLIIFRPLLSIHPDGTGAVTVSWTPDEAGWMLQVAPTTPPLLWILAPSGSTNPVTLATGAAARMYRLIKP